MEVLGAAGAGNEVRRLGHQKLPVPECSAGSGAIRRCGSRRAAQDPRAVTIAQ